MIDATPLLIEWFIDRANTEMPDDYLRQASEVIIAGDRMLLSAGYLNMGKQPSGWLQENCALYRRSPPSRDPRVFEPGERTLQVRRVGDFWAIECLAVAGRNQIRQDPFLIFPVKLALVCAFTEWPIWTRNCDSAMMLAEHCEPVPRSVAARWKDVLN